VGQTITIVKDTGGFPQYGYSKKEDRRSLGSHIFGVDTQIPIKSGGRSRTLGDSRKGRWKNGVTGLPVFGNNELVGTGKEWMSEKSGRGRREGSNSRDIGGSITRET